MTSGQGGNPPGGPYGPPEGWNAPKAPGPQYPAYAPAPSAPTGYGAPEPLDRPTTVRAGLGAFIGSMVLSAVAQVVSLFNRETIVDWTLANGGPQPDPAAARAGVEVIVRITSIVGLLFIAVYALFVWFAWGGRNWARIVLWVFAGLGIMGGVAGLAVGGPLPFLRALGGFQLLLVIAAVVLLALKQSNDWYRFRKWQRMTGQG